MNETLIDSHNSLVRCNDVVIHCGDFCWAKNRTQAAVYYSRLAGNHIFLKGSHDGWLPASAKYMWRKVIDGQLVVACHYAMRTWEQAHYGSWQVYGHSHGQLLPIGKQWDVGVDNNHFYPVSFNELRQIMEARPLERLYEHGGPNE